MTPKEKAKELVYEFLMYVESDFIDSNSEINNAKQCALIAVNQVIESHYKLLSGVNPSVYNFWQEVKQEIEKL